MQLSWTSNLSSSENETIDDDTLQSRCLLYDLKIIFNFVLSLFSCLIICSMNNTNCFLVRKIRRYNQFLFVQVAPSNDNPFLVGVINIQLRP